MSVGTYVIMFSCSFFVLTEFVVMSYSKVLIPGECLMLSCTSWDAFQSDLSKYWLTLTMAVKKSS